MAVAADGGAHLIDGDPDTLWLMPRSLTVDDFWVWQYIDDVRAGRMSMADYERLEAAAGPSRGHCPEMGTASTMATIVEGWA